jgi:hypothetical protein
VAPKVVTGWRARAAVLSPSHFRDAAPEVRWVLLAALLVERQWEITDTLVELLISTVHAINARADRRVTEEMVASFKRVRNKTVLLAKISQASLDRPDGAVRDVVFPVAGGAQTLREVVASFGPTDPSSAATCRSNRETHVNRQPDWATGSRQGADDPAASQWAE